MTKEELQKQNKKNFAIKVFQFLMNKNTVKSQI